MKRKLLLLVAASLLGNPIPAFSQTAEETVLFMLFGYDKLGEPNNFPGIALPNGGKITLKASAEKITNCVYNVTINAGPKSATYIFNFESLTKYDALRHPNGMEVILWGPNLLKEPMRNNATNVFASKAAIVRDPERYYKAAAYFRANFCKGRAF